MFRNYEVYDFEVLDKTNSNESYILNRTVIIEKYNPNSKFSYKRFSKFSSYSDLKVFATGATYQMDYYDYDAEELIEKEPYEEPAFFGLLVHDCQHRQLDKEFVPP